MIQWADNFKLYGGTESFMDDGLYAQTERLALTEDPDPNVTGDVVLFEEIVSNGNQGLRKVLNAETDTIGVAMRIWLPGLPSDSAVLPWPIMIRNSDNETLSYIRVLTTGALEVRNSSGTLIGTTGGPVLVSNAWQHLEMKIFLNSITGTVEVRVNGITVINETNVDTVGGNTPITAAQILSSGDKSGGGSKEYYIKDYVIWDTTGTHNTDFLGSVSVYNLFPDADSVLTWTPSTGSTGFNLVDNVPPVDGTDYISAELPLPDQTEFTLTNLPTDVTSVRGVMVIHRSRTIDGGDGNVQTGMISNGTEDKGTDRPITSAFTYWYDWFEEDPDTNMPWAPGDLDLAKVSIDRTV